jgi:inorganic pyrophosphatase
MSGIVSWPGRHRGCRCDRVSRLGSLAVVALTVVMCTRVPRRSIVAGAPVAREALAPDDETVVGRHHFAHGYPAQNSDDSVNAVIEIPCGTTAKFEVSDDDGRLHWQRDRDHGGRRELDYLAFLVNYGMVPRTLAADGDALDIIVLGRGIERGHVARTRVIGVLLMGDADSRDDKLVAVPVEPELENGFTRLHDLGELDIHYPAARAILELWFANYWGAGATHVIGWGDAAAARAILEASKLPPGAAGPRPRARSPSCGPARSPRAPDPAAAPGTAC